MSHARTRNRRLLISAILTLVLLGGLRVLQTPDLRGATAATPTPLGYLPLIARAGPTATSSVQACGSVYPIGISAALLDTNGFIPPTDPAELPYYGRYTDGTYTNKTQRRLYQHDEFGTPLLDYHFLTWQGGTSDLDAFSAALAGAGTLDQGFDEVVPWPDPNWASPDGYPFLPHELNPGDWIAVFEGAPDDPRVLAALDDHILRHTVMALPIFDRAVYSSTLGALHHNRIGSFLLRGYDIHNYLDLVYLGEADPIFCSSTATATSTSAFTATPHFSTVTPTTISTPTESPTITLTPQVMNLYITNFYYAPAIGNNVRPISLKALVVRNGLPFNQALVNGTITRGSVPTSVTLVSIGNGYYIVCDVGNYTGTGATPTVSLTATDGVGNSASATSSAPSPTKFSECP